MHLSSKAFKKWQSYLSEPASDEQRHPVDFSKEQRRMEILDDLQERRRKDLETRYLWRLTDDSKPDRRRAALELSREVSNADDAAYIVRRVAEVGQAKKWAEQQRSTKKSFLRRVGETITELPQQASEGSTEILDRFQGLGRVLAGGDSDRSRVLFKNLLENAYTEQDPTNIERHGKVWKAARGGARMAPQVALGAAAYTRLGSLGIVGTTAGQTFAPLRERLVMEGVNPSTATKLAAITSVVEGAIETAVPVPGFGKGALEKAGGQISKKAISRIAGTKLGKKILSQASEKLGGKAVADVAGKLGLGYLGEVSEEGLQSGAESAVSLLGAGLSGRLEGRDISEITTEALGGLKEASGPLLPFSLIGGGVQLTNLQSQAKIIQMANEGHTPSRKEWLKLGLPAKEGRSKAARAAAIQLLAKQMKSTTREVRVSEPPESTRTATYEEATKESEVVPTSQEAQAQEVVSEQQAENDLRMEREANKIPQESGSPELTSTKASIRDDILRQARGETPVPGEAAETVEQWITEAQQMISDDHTLPYRLIDEIKNRPRPLNEREHMVMQLHYRQLNSTLHQQSDAIQNAPSSVERAQANTLANLTESAIQEVEKTLESKSWEILDQEQAAKLAGTRWGRAGVAQQVMLRQDYSPSALVRKHTVAKGASLTEDEVSAAVEMGNKVQELEQKIEQLEKLAPQQQAIDSEINRIRTEFKKQKRSIKKSIARQQVNDAWKNFKKQLPKLEEGGSVSRFLKGESGALDIEAIEAAANVIRAYVGLGALTLSEILANAKTTLGTKYDASLVALTEAWKNMLENGEVNNLQLSRDDPQQVKRAAKQMQKSFVEAGYTERNVIVGMVNQEILNSIPDWTATETMDVLSGYGKYQEREQDEVRRTVNDINKQLTQIRKLQDIEQGKELPVSRKGYPASDELQALQKQVRKSMKEAGYGTYSIDAYKKRLLERIKSYEDKIKSGNFAKEVKSEPKQDQEVADLKFDLDKLKSRVRTEEQKYRRKQRTTAQKMLGVVPDVFNTVRAYMISFDLSAIGRQGFPFVLAHPMQAAKNFGPMIEALKSERAQFRYVDQLRERSKKSKYSYDQVGLAVTVSQERLQKQEEAYLGNWTPYIPGVSASERAYTTFLSLARADMYDLLVHNAAKCGDVTLDEAKILANFVNVATGRGDLGRFEPAAVALATVFFAPRYVASRFQYLLGVPLWKGNPKTRRVIAAEYGRMLAGLSVFYGAVQAAATMYNDDDPRRPKVEWDVRSADFGKVQVGNTRVDPLFGLSQTTVLLGREITGKTKTIRGKVIPLSGQTIPYGGSNRYDVLTRFLRTKFAPHISLAIDVGTGQTVVGEEVTPASVTYGATVPLVGRDVYETLREQGMSKEGALGILAIFGMGVQNYSSRPPMRGRKRARIMVR